MKKILTNNILLKVLSILFAVILWLVVVNIDDPTVTRMITGIPVVTQDEDVLVNQKQVYEIVSGDTATIVIKGPRSYVDKMTKEDFVAEASFNEMSSVYAVPITVKHRYSKYEKSVDITQKTTTMTLQVENIITRNYEIQVEEIGNTPSGYTMGSETVQPTTVEVTAPESVINLINKAVVEVNLSKYSASDKVSLPVKFYTKSGTLVDMGSHSQLSDDTADVSLNVYPVKEVPLKFGSVGTPADGYSLTDIESDVKMVKIAGENVSDIDSIIIPSEVVDIQGKSDNVAISIDITGYLPDGVILYNDENSKVNIVAKIEKLVVKKFTIATKDIKLKNSTKDFSISYVDGNSVTIQLKGLQSVFDSFDEDSLEPYIDLGSIVEGNNSVTINVTLSDNITEVAIPTVNIMAALKSSDDKQDTTSNTTKPSTEDSKETTAKPTVSGETTQKNN